MTKKTTMLYIFSHLLLFFIVSIFYYLNLSALYPSVINIPQGSIKKIMGNLRFNDLDANHLDSFLMRFIGNPQSGWINIIPNVGDKTTKASFLYQLARNKSALKEITLIPGETMHFFILHISETLGLDEVELKSAYDEFSDYPDGVIFPDTYKVPLDIGPRYLMSHLISTSLKKHKAISEKLMGRYDVKQWFSYISIASIVQKESANVEEMPLVSAVIFNRLKLKMPLQMDGALNYGQYSHEKITSQRIRSDTSIYNTYKYRGIPPYPVCAASLDAIKAAFKPANVNYLYFVRNSRGGHSFSSSYDEHVKNIR